MTNTQGTKWSIANTPFMSDNASLNHVLVAGCHYAWYGACLQWLYPFPDTQLNSLLPSYKIETVRGSIERIWSHARINILPNLDVRMTIGKQEQEDKRRKEKQSKLEKIPRDRALSWALVVLVTVGFRLTIGRDSCAVGEMGPRKCIGTSGHTGKDETLPPYFPNFIASN